MKTMRRIADAEAVIAGLATVALAVATGNWQVVLFAAAVASGAGLLASVEDCRKVEARSEEARRLHQREAALEQARGPEVGIEERIARLRECHVPLDGGPEDGTGQFRERVLAEPGRDWKRGR